MKTIKGRSDTQKTKMLQGLFKNGADACGCGSVSVIQVSGSVPFATDIFFYGIFQHEYRHLFDFKS